MLSDDVANKIKSYLVKFSSNYTVAETLEEKINISTAITLLNSALNSNEDKLANKLISQSIKVSKG